MKKKLKASAIAALAGLSMFAQTQRQFEFEEFTGLSRIALEASNFYCGYSDRSDVPPYVNRFWADDCWWQWDEYDSSLRLMCYSNPKQAE